MAEYNGLSVPLSDLINCLSHTIDLVSPELADHHRRVGLITCALARQLGFSEDDCADLYFAANLHDIGALSLTDRMSLLRFEGSEPHQHAETGALLLETFGPLARLSGLVRYHHVHWLDGAGEMENGSEVPFGSHILHLADRIAVLIGATEGIQVLTRVRDILRKIEHASGDMFAPVLVEAFRDLSSRESFWLGIAYPAHGRKFEANGQFRTFRLDTAGILGLSRMFARIIDFRSRFTATHSSGVAASAETLARLSGRPLAECEQMRIAGLLHDLGKLAVPAELLDKSFGLSLEERALIRCHSFFTRRALENIRSFEAITAWGSNHHERIDGTGYPNHVGGDELSIGSRIMAVSDVFTAITENRPYRVGMVRESARKALYSMVAQKALDPDLVGILMDNYDELNEARARAQAEAVAEYGTVCATLARHSACHT